MAESMLNYCKKREQCLFLTYGSKYKMDVEMKLSIFEKKSIDETEVVINCKSRNPEIDKLAKHIIQYDESISCRRDGRDYNIMVALFGTIGNSNTSCRQVATQEQMNRF